MTQAPQLPILREPADGIPTVIDTPQALADAVAALEAGSGPIGIDTERAQSFRYTGRAYLIQLRRAGAGTFLIDPLPFDGGGLADLARVVAPVEWVLHAASQDLPCLIDAGLVPTTLFDTELSGRLLGLPRVGLGPMIEHYFGVQLLKEHSAADWSTRPLPRDWIIYAALDVELLAELRDKMADELTAVGKDGWAREEFAHEIETALHPCPPRPDRWRHTSGIHAVRTSLGLALVRELWTARDRIARAEDLAPGQILQDKAISELASQITRTQPRVPTVVQMRTIEGFKRRRARQHADVWADVLARMAALPTAQLPPMKTPHDGPPPTRVWAKRDPAAYSRWMAARPVTVAVAESWSLPVENLISPDSLHRLLWTPPEDQSAASLDGRLAELGVRPWQRELLAAPIADALAALATPT